jgi:hypothetical protein
MGEDENLDMQIMKKATTIPVTMNRTKNRTIGDTY